MYHATFAGCSEDKLAKAERIPHTIVKSREVLTAFRLFKAPDALKV